MDHAGEVRPAGVAEDLLQIAGEPEVGARLAIRAGLAVRAGLATGARLAIGVTSRSSCEWYLVIKWRFMAVVPACEMFLGA